MFVHLGFVAAVVLQEIVLLTTAVLLWLPLRQFALLVIWLATLTLPIGVWLGPMAWWLTGVAQQWPVQAVMLALFVPTVVLLSALLAPVAVVAFAMLHRLERSILALRLNEHFSVV